MTEAETLRELTRLSKELDHSLSNQHKVLAKTLRECLTALSPPSPHADAATLSELRENKAALVKVLPQIIALLEGEEA